MSSLCGIDCKVLKRKFISN